MNPIKHTLLYCSLVLCLLLFTLSSKAQTGFYGQGPVNWEVRKPYVMPAEAEQYAGSDLLVLSDITEFYFYDNNNEKLIRNIKYKINTQKGLDELKHYRTPETFDFAFDRELYKQSRRSRIKIPYIKEYAIKVFAARKFSNKRWANVSVTDTYEQVKWIKNSGEFTEEDYTVFKLGSLAIGDVVEIYYEASFNSLYGINIFYMTGPHPKLYCEYDFIFKVAKTFPDDSYILPVHIPDSAISNSKVDYDDYYLVTTKLKLANLRANNYPLNSFEGVKIPHVCADFSFYRSQVSYPNNRFVQTKSGKLKNFEWVISLETNPVSQTRIYDKQFTGIHKFVGTMPPIGSDSQNVVFFRALCDTFNNYRYISPNHLFYNESNLYEMYSSDHLLKRRLPGHTLWKLYNDILTDSKLFYYLVNVQDKRFGEHEFKHRSHYGYEHSLLALPVNNSFIYFMPRYSGLRYHLNELPFYYEGVLAAFSPMNFQPDTKNKETKVFKIIKTHRGTFNENTRTENASVKIVLDSLTARLTIKESLSGQFSTVLRHLYLNELIDSTIAPAYFRKCLDKPNSGSYSTKLSSKMNEFPYRYNFTCNEKLGFKSHTSFPLKNWFSFTLNKTTISQKPNYDYHFDFDFSDTYNFLLDFNVPVELKNSDLFSQHLSNEYFELETAIIKNTDSTYLVKANLVVKQTSIPREKAHLLMELVDALEQVNNFELELAKK